MSSIRSFFLQLACVQILAAGVTFADETPLNAPGDQTDVPVANVLTKAWQTSADTKSLAFQPSSAWTAPAAGPLYLEVTYLDKGYGHLLVTFPGTDGKADPADKTTHAYLLDSGTWITCYMRLNNIALSSAPEIQVTREKGTADPLTIAKVGISATPFPDAHLQYLLDEAWMKPYAGPAGTPPTDNTTLKGKIMVGYQGWFGTPNDPYESGGWSHWGDIQKKHFSTDMWPNAADYPASALDKACDVKTLSGKQGYLFSDAWPETVSTQFHWMKTHNIDGAFVQRFVRTHSYAVNGFQDWVLGNVRAAAHQEGRLWAIEYDASGLDDTTLQADIQKDWSWMVDSLQINKDPNYARVGGKPVVFVWGLGVSGRNFTPASSAAMIDFLKNDPKYGGNYVIEGGPGNWSKLPQDWLDVYKKCDGVQGWMSANYAEDLAKCKDLGIDYYGHIKPGFSWANTMHIPSGSTTAFTPRDGGHFYEGLISKAAQAGVDHMVVGMFDEYNESTAIMPMSDDPPPTPVEPGAALELFPNPKGNAKGTSLTETQVLYNFDGQPPKRGIPGENFTMQWSGSIQAPSDGSYVLYVTGLPGDSATLYINDKRVMNIKDFAADTNSSVTVPMTTAQKTTYRLEYNHASGQGTFSLDWQGPPGDRAPIPATALVDAWGRFLTNEGQVPDIYLKLTSELRDMMNGTHSPTDLSLPPATTSTAQ